MITFISKNINAIRFILYSQVKISCLDITLIHFKMKNKIIKIIILTVYIRDVKQSVLIKAC